MSRLRRRLGLHLVLLSFAAAFLFPFVWMILTSAKTDEELAAGKWFPSMPRFRDVSPYQTAGPAGNAVEGSLELLQLQVRSLNAEIFNVISGSGIAEAWVVESGDARLLPKESSARVIYRFASHDAPPIILRYDFGSPVDLKQLHKLIVSLRADDSWHRVHAQLDFGGRTLESTRPTYLAQHRPMSILFQPPTFDDQTMQPKIWVPLRTTDRAAQNDDNRATLRLIIQPSSTPQAIWGKLTRNFVRIFHSIPFWQYMFNSVLLVVLTVLGTLFSSTFVAYAFARLNWPGRSIALLLLLSTMMLPEQVTMIPSFLIWQKLGWYNTLNPIWVPTFLGATFTPLFGSAFFIYLMVQHMKTLPRELEEAARIDGLNHLQTWYYIMLPQVKPAAAAIATLAFLAAWNDFLRPLIYLRDQSRFPLSLGLLAAQIENRADWTLIMAGNVLMTLPVIAIFFLFQRYFVQGISGTGIK